nr:uncharacterized mitochondrial protein AtMg00810-like [Tanacetum cinerariifolium]
MHITCYCARYQAQPTEKHLTAVKRIFQYLKDTIHMGLWYLKDTGFELTAFSDSNHAGCLDSPTSRSGGIQFLGGDKLVSWLSKKQDCTSMSSAEAEYVSLSACCAQVLWMRTQLIDYGFHFDKNLCIQNWADPFKDLKWSNVPVVKFSSLSKSDDTFLSLQALSNLYYLLDGFMDYLWSCELDISIFGLADRLEACLLVFGWVFHFIHQFRDDMPYSCLIEYLKRIDCQNLDVKQLLRSEMMDIGTPCCETISFIYNLVRDSILSVALMGIKCAVLIVPAFLKELIYKVLGLLVPLLELNRFVILLGEPEEGQAVSSVIGKILSIEARDMDKKLLSAPESNNTLARYASYENSFQSQIPKVGQRNQWRRMIGNGLVFEVAKSHQEERNPEDQIVVLVVTLKMEVKRLVEQ